MTIGWTLLSFLVTIAILIVIHEVGHFWVARKLGVKVLRFSLGFGTPLWQRTGKDGVEYVVAAVPLGGYVKLLDENEGEVAKEELPYAFNRQPLMTRALVVFAGPMANLLLTLLVYWVVSLVGVTGSKPMIGEVLPHSPAAQGGFQSGDEFILVGDKKVATWEQTLLLLMDRLMGNQHVDITVRDRDGHSQFRSLTVDASLILGGSKNMLTTLGLAPQRPEIPPRIGKVMPEGPAAKAGLLPGDRILSVEGQPVSHWQAWAEFVRQHPKQWLQVTVLRDNQEKFLKIYPDLGEDGVSGRVGVLAQVPGSEELMPFQVVVRYNLWEGAGYSIEKTWLLAHLTLRAFVTMLTGQASLDNVSGPISIAQYAGESASLGWMAFLEFLALISVNLAVLNLLPIPMLDGGHLFYYGIEWIRGTPLSETIQNIGQNIGLAILLALMGLAMYNDIARLINP